VREVTLSRSPKEGYLHHRFRMPLLNSRQLYSSNAVFCEHRTKPEFLCVFCLATIRL
jgi:hypothetical protein